MPSRNTRRTFTKESIHHIYNRGINKQSIFLDDADYKMFLYYMFIYLAPLPQVLKKYPEHPLRLQSKNIHEEAEVLAYCLMPNHFHLLLRQHTLNGITQFMKQVSNAYTKYFNTKYERSGPLFQGRYKSIEIKEDQLLLYVSRYIHLNPFVAGLTSNVKMDRWSSFNAYVNSKNNSFCNTTLILSHFSKPKDYEVFVMNHKDYTRELGKIKHLTLE